jgi:hypothetical protein
MRLREEQSVDDPLRLTRTGVASLGGAHVPCRRRFDVADVLGTDDARTAVSACSLGVLANASPRPDAGRELERESAMNGRTR